METVKERGGRDDEREKKGEGAREECGWKWKGSDVMGKTVIVDGQSMWV